MNVQRQKYCCCFKCWLMWSPKEITLLQLGVTHQKLFHWQLQVLYLFSILDTKHQAELLTHSFMPKAPTVKMPEPLLFSPPIFSGNVCWIHQLDFWEDAQEVKHGCTWLMNSTSKCTSYWWVLNRSHLVLIWFFKILQANSRNSPPR